MRLTLLTATLSILALPALAQAPSVPMTPGAAPQGQQEMVRMLHRAAHNQLGVLEYCQAQGSIGADTVDLQRRLIGLLPPAQVDGLDSAEAMGKQGVVAFSGSQVPIADAARTQNTTPDAMCKQMATMLQTQAAQLPH